MPALGVTAKLAMAPGGRSSGAFRRRAGAHQLSGPALAVLQPSEKGLSVQICGGCTQNSNAWGGASGDRKQLRGACSPQELRRASETGGDNSCSPARSPSVRQSSTCFQTVEAVPWMLVTTPKYLPTTALLGKFSVYVVARKAI